MIAPAGRRVTWRERVFVLAGPILALAATVIWIATGEGGRLLGPLGVAAIAWTAAASLAAALRRGFRHGDRSAFHDYEFPEDDGEIHEWSSRTGRYRYLADLERPVRDDGHLRNHDLS